MNFTHLEYAAAAARHGSISRAAQELFVSQPYLSSTIKKLEEELGFQIFNRTRSGITLTPTGQEFITSACQILLEWNKIKKLSPSHIEEPVRVAAYYSAFITRMFLGFIKESNMNVSDSMSEMGVKEIFQSILSGENSLGIFFYAPTKRNAYLHMGEEYRCDCKDLFPPFPIYAFAASAHPLAAFPSVSLKDMKKYKYVFYNDSSSLKYLKLLGIGSADQVLKVSDRGSFIDAISTGEYISLASALEMPSSSNFVLIPIEDAGFYVNSCYVTEKKHRLSSREHAFILYLRSKFTEQMKKQAGSIH